MEHQRHSVTISSAAQHSHRQCRLPGALDLSAWLSVSRDLRLERDRVLEGLDEVCRELTPR